MSPWHFAFASDIHIGTPRSFRYQPSWNQRWEVARQQIIDSQPEILIVGGDLTRDGHSHRFELEQARDSLAGMGIPYHVVPGNHDVGHKFLPDAEAAIQADYVRLYRSVFGCDQWSFVHKNVRFSGFNSFLAGSGLPEEAEFWTWLEAQVQQPRASHHVWITHAPLFYNTMDEANWNHKTNRTEWYFSIDEPHRSRMLDAFKRSGSTIVMCGHLHCRRIVCEEGVTFVYAPSTAFPAGKVLWPGGDTSLGWLDCQVTPDGITTQFVPLAADIPQTGGYGPGGSPPLTNRDYSIAQEQPPLDINEQRFPRA